MAMPNLIHFLILIPLEGFLLSVLIAPKNERLISFITFFTAGIHLIVSLALIILWGLNGFPLIEVKGITLYGSPEYNFFIDFYFDKIAATYLIVGSVLTFLVTVYSRYYLHREEGYKRFFNTILFFFTGYNVVVLSGNLETLFIGWEVLSLSSFLLIAFYRHRYLPVRNAVKVFSVYRVSDMGIMLAIWLSHHLWHANITFQQLGNSALVDRQIETHTLVGIFTALMLLVSAATKSAQLPFSSWLPRAMEGPTPSSAIFYGSLSVHLGVFLLLRTASFWEHMLLVRILVGVLGLCTAVVATGMARVQSSVKSQVAYASVAQIGIIFIEIALGLERLALLHFAGNAFLRTYQLLVSPSVVSYLIREQFFHFVPRQHTYEDSLPKKLQYSFYMLCLKEWNLDAFMYRYLWYPLKWVGRKFAFINLNYILLVILPLYLLGLFFLYRKAMIPEPLQGYLPVIFSIVGLIMALRSFSKRKLVTLSWVLVILNHFWIALAVSYNEHITWTQIALYLSGVVVFGIIGLACLRWLISREEIIDLDRFYGYARRYPLVAFVFLLSALAVAGFPISPTVIGEDLIFSHIHEEQFLLASSVSLSFIIDALAVIRIYARVFLGPHGKSPYEMAYRSS